MTFNLRTIPIRWRLASMLIVTLIGMAILSAVAMNEIRAVMLQEKAIKTQHLVESAHDMLDYWHGKVEEGQLSPAEARENALESLRYMRYGDGDYFWVQDLEGEIIMHPTKPELEGRNALHVQDPNGVYLFQEMTNLARNQGKGTVHYHWPKPGQNKPVSKIAYVEHEPKWNWVIGSGIYIDDVDQQFWKSVALFLIIAGAAAAVIMVMVVTIAGSIIRPINRTVDAMDEISQGEGDLTKHIEADGNDEICRMVRHFNKFVESQ